MSKLIDGIVPALCTPFDSNGEVDSGVASALAGSLIEAGVKGFFVCGSTGEGRSMTVPERQLMGEVVVESVAGQVPVILHVGATETVNAVELARHAAAAGADAVGSVAPIEKPNDLEAAVRHYRSIGETSDLPFYVYWLANDADRTVTAEQYLEAMESVPNFAGFKFTDTNFYLFEQLVSLSDGKLNAVTGPDEMCLAGLVMGSDGAIGTTYNIMPRLFNHLFESFHSGDIRAAMAAQKKANRVLSMLFRYGALSATKVILQWQGFDVGSTREPYDAVSPEAQANLRKEVETLGFEIE